MKAEEKKLIYDLLKSAAANAYGYTPEAFSKEAVFADDAVSAEKTADSADKANTEVLPEEIKSSQNSEAFSPANQDAQNSQVASVNQAAQNLQKETPSTHKITLEDIQAKIARCTRCKLARTRNNVVPGTGVKNPEVMVIGEGPGYEEDMQGLPFVGKAGKLLDKMLNAIQLDRSTNCYIANVVKCRPPQNRDPLPDEEAACFSFLEAQIHILKPKMILCMGRIAGHKLLDTQAPMKEMRGQFFEYNKIPVMVTYHPSALLRDESLKRPAWEDLKKFRAELNRILSQQPDMIQEK